MPVLFICCSDCLGYISLRILGFGEQKGVRGFAPNINSGVCGEQVDFQGEAGGKILAKIAKKFVERMSETNEVSNFRDL